MRLADLIMCFSEKGVSITTGPTRIEGEVPDFVPKLKLKYVHTKIYPTVNISMHSILVYSEYLIKLYALAFTLKSGRGCCADLVICARVINAVLFI